MTRWIILTAIVLAVPTGVALSGIRDRTPSDRTAQALTIKQYWVAEFRQRWKTQRKTAHRQAEIIRALRAKNHTLTEGVRSLQQAMKTSPYGTNFLETGFLCIHTYERGAAGWQTNTGNGYFGGLQMDEDFMETYGPEFLRAFGTADNWPISVQIAVAIKAHLSGRGYGPWPNTRRMCGI